MFAQGVGGRRMNAEGLVYGWLQGLQREWSELGVLGLPAFYLPISCHHCPAVMALSSPEPVVASGAFLTMLPVVTASSRDETYLPTSRKAVGAILDS